MMFIEKISLFFHKQEGQSLMEYAVILCFVFLMVFAAVTLIGGQVLALFRNFINAF